MARRLSEKEFLRLAEMLRQHLPVSLKIYGTLMSTMQGKMTFEFWVDGWPSFKCVLAKGYQLDSYYKNVYSVFHTDQNAMVELLNTPGVVDWNIPALFGGWSCDEIPIFLDLAATHDCDVDLSSLVKADIYYMDKDCITNIDPPDDVTLGSLTMEHAELVNETWEHGSCLSLPFIQKHIQFFPNVCLFDKTGYPLAYELMMYNGSMGILFVRPEHRKKGYARYLTSILSTKIQAIDQIPYVFIDRDNSPSRHLHESVGFNKALCPLVTWIKSSPKINRGQCVTKGCGTKKDCCI